MDKLEMKHLAAYLPYKLKVKLLNFPVGDGIRTFELDCGHDFHYYLQSGFVKPILRPLSDFGCDVTFGGKTFKSDEYISTSIKDSQLNYRKITEDGLCDQLEQWKFERLCQMLFDVFGLIEKGLALDINTING